MTNNNVYLNQNEFEDVFKRHIKTGVYSISIKTLFGKRMTRKTNYHPYYQRNYVWDNSKATFFIESILLGTDVPPLIFFNSGSTIEVIDGRQRFETIKNFINNDFKLSINGLSKLPQLKNHTFDKLDEDIQNLLMNAKIRVFEFEVFNEPRMSTILEDKIKKEIFRRYNSGITPLNSAEIDNATYDDDDITALFKKMIETDSELLEVVRTKFLGRKVCDTSHVLQFLRRYLVLSSFPINTYATGSSRKEIIELLYGVISNNTTNQHELCESLFENLKISLSLIDSLSVKNNKQINETILWAINILSEADISLTNLLEKDTIKTINEYLLDHSDSFLDEKSHHYGSIILRYKAISRIFSKLYHFDFSSYFKNEDFKDEITSLRQSKQEAKLKLEELSSLRVQKPEPSVIPIEEIATELSTNAYLLRPSYQRLEKISPLKASAIIESIILGINLPPLFIFKNSNRVNEVIDGQQRLLSILGFLGENYLDENKNICTPKLSNFKLQKLKILRNLDGLRYTDLDCTIQDKILEFKLSIIEIDQALNPSFEPVDLFIRLNNKPYPIKENSFEMWNSFADKDIIESIKEITKNNIDWFYLRSKNGSDRMLNEELITFLSYIHYNLLKRPEYTSIGYYLRDGRINCRITNKKDISILLEKVATDVVLKDNLLKSISAISNYLAMLKDKLDSNDYNTSLNELLGRNGSSRRFLVDFYVLFQILHRLNDDDISQISYSSLKEKMTKVKTEINTPTNLVQGTQQQYFETLLDDVSKV